MKKMISKKLNVTFGILLVLLFALGPILKAQATIESDNIINDPKNYNFAEKIKYNKAWQLDKKISIYYDMNNIVVLKTAFGVYSGLKNLYANIEFLAVNNSAQFKNYVSSPDSFIKMYFFEGDLYGLNVGNDFFAWQQIAKMFNNEKLFHHILASGSTIELTKYIDIEKNDHIHIDESDIVDAQTSFVYYMFETSDILLNDEQEEYQLAGQDIRDLTVIYFAENLNAIANAQINPVAPMGQRDEAFYKKQFQDKLDSYGYVHQILPDGSKRYLNDTAAPMADTGILMYPKDTDSISIAKDEYFFLDVDERSSQKASNLVTIIAEPEFRITDLPLFSGLEGPVAGIIDTLLDVLIKAGGEQLGLNPSLVTEMANVVKEIGGFISDVSQGSGDAKDTVKSLIKRIANVAPIPEPLKLWLPIIIDSIFLYKAKPLEIVAFAKDVMILIFNQTAGLFNNSVLSSITNVLEQVMLSAVDLTVRLLEDEENAKAEGTSFSAMSSIATFFFEKMLNFTTFEFIASMIGTVNSTVMKETNALMQLIIPLIKSFIFGDLGDVIAAIPPMVEYSINKLNEARPDYSGSKIGFSEAQKSAFESVGRFFDMAMQIYTAYSDCGGSLDLFTGGNLAGGLVKLVKSLLPLVDFQVGQNFALSKVVNMVSELMTTFADASRDLLTDRSILKINIKSVLTKYGLPTVGQTVNIISEILTFLGQITISSMTKPTSSDLRGVVDELLDAIMPAAAIQINVFKVLSPLEVENIKALPEWVKETTKEMITVIIDSVFGLLALSANGASAQFLLLDDFFQISDKTAGCTDAVTALAQNKIGALSQSELQTQLLDLVKNQVMNLVEYFIGNLVPDNGNMYVSMLAETLITVLSLILNGDGNSIMPTIQSMLMQGIGIFLSKILGVDGTIIARVVVNLFSGLISGQAFGSTASQFFSTLVSASEIRAITDQSLVSNGASSATRALAGTGIEFIFGLKDLFTDALSWIFKQFEAYILSAISNFLTGLLDKLIGIATETPILSLGGGIPFKGADVIGLEFEFELTLKLNLDIDIKSFVQWIFDMVFKGNSDIKRGISYFFKKMISFISFSPIFGASLEVGTMSSGKPGMITILLAALPFDLSFTGKAFFELLFISIKSGGVEPGSLLRILKWGLSIVITISKDITVLDVVTGGAGGSLNKVGKYIGLSSIVITIYFKIGIEIFYQAAKADEEAITKLTFFLTIGAKIFVGLDLTIVKIGLELGVEVTLKFVQDLLFINKPLQITLDIFVWAKVILTFLFISWEGKLKFTPPGFPLDISPKAGSKDLEELAYGMDFDRDGLSNSLEDINPDLNPNEPDTDFDGLSDKFELRVSKTNPNNADTDGDGVTDFAEYILFKTDPFVQDTDLDGLSDFEELYIYLTNPKAPDTDGDKLNDWWEVNHEYNMTGIDPSVKFVIIGGEVYTNKTDPLDFDTDDDGIPDGQEDVFGPYFGYAGNYYNDKDNSQTDGSGFKSRPDCYEDTSCLVDPLFIRNGGYTHPLDNDTDDDSYFQFYDGKMYYDGLGQPRFIGDLSDGAELAGIRATIQKYDPVRDTPIWVTKVFYTNPTNPDSDGDSAICSANDKNGDSGPGYPWGEGNDCSSRQFGLPDGINPNRYLNGDGYELFEALTDPLDPDTDSDGLIDGLEGTLLPLRDFTTNPFKPDTDGDGLPDGLEFFLGTDPDNPDTDNDQVLDGDEFFKYFTDPLLEDTDFDGINDGWELFFSHSNPHSQDSDLDGLSDFQEIYFFGTDPMDEDSDNDDLDDRSEIFIYETNPNKKDTDADGLRDGEEIFTYFTDPNNPDTDGDSILWENEDGDPTFLWLDGQEVAYGTDPNSIDTDLDSITDAWEMYLATSDKLPIPNIEIDPRNNDTDGDGLLDGQEMLVNETYSLIYPYVAYFVFYVYGSSPVDSDTDGDGLDDYYEVNELMNPNSTDTDGDTLHDWDEIFIHLTDPRLADTDGDGIDDNLEVTAAPDSQSNATLMALRTKITGLKGTYATPLYATSASDPDTDGDGWPDGMEIFATDGDSRYDPYVADTNNNGVKDGYERDYDNDLISDGDEFYTYQGKGNHTGGFLSYKNPDSDFDGLLDGDEILIYGTLPYEADTDNDTYSDSIELYFGTDPLVFTPEYVFLALVQAKNSVLQFLSPTEDSIIPDSAVTVEVLSYTESTIESAWVQYRVITVTNRFIKPIEDDWSETYDMTLGAGLFGLETPTWKSNPLPLEQEKEYEIRVQAIALNYSYPTSPDKVLPSVMLENTVRFKIHNDDPFGLTPGFYQTVGIGVLFIVLSAGGGVIYMRRRKVSL